MRRRGCGLPTTPTWLELAKSLVHIYIYTCMYIYIYIYICSSYATRNPEPCAGFCIELPTTSRTTQGPHQLDCGAIVELLGDSRQDGVEVQFVPARCSGLRAWCWPIDSSSQGRSGSLSSTGTGGFELCLKHGHLACRSVCMSLSVYAPLRAFTAHDANMTLVACFKRQQFEIHNNLWPQRLFKAAYATFS